MSLVPIKRFQQGVFEALASQNRVYGSGGGSALGLRPLGVASIGTVAGITASGSPTVVTGSTVNFVVPPGVFAVLIIGTLNAGSNCGAGLFNLIALSGSAGLNPQDAWPTAMLLGIGVGSINYIPATLFTIATTSPGAQSVDWEVDANTNGSVTVNNGYLDVLALG